jgi:phenylacetate-CoA ligase
MANNKTTSRLLSFPVLKQTKNSLYRVFPKLFVPSKEYSKWSDFIDSSQWWSEPQIQEYQWKKVKEMLAYCYQKIPYYQGIFKSLGATPEDFRTKEDFTKFPFLTKELIGRHAEELLPVGVNRKKIIRYNTGGSTGLPLLLYKSHVDEIIEEAFMFNQWGRVGFKPKDCRVILRGEVIENNALWKYRPSSNTWIFSSFHLSKEYIVQMVNKINTIKPDFLHVIPSTLWVFANLIKENNLKLNFIPKAILCGSEKLFDHQRKLFTEVFQCRTYTWLGLAEQTTLAGECEQSTDLHIFPQHSYVELVDTAGNVIREPGITGHIVGTNLFRYTFPLMRYKSGDLAQYAKSPCKCGRQFKLFKELEGRAQAMIVSLDGRIIPVQSLIFVRHLLDYTKVEKMQVVQREVGKLEIRIIKGTKFKDEDAAILLDQLLHVVNNTLSFTLTYHDSLERTPSGKEKFLIQMLPVEYYSADENG